MINFEIGLESLVPPGAWKWPPEYSHPPLYSHLIPLPGQLALRDGKG